MAKPDDNTPLLEWIVAAVGAATLATVLGLIIYGIATRGDAPPSFRFETVSIRQAGEAWHVHFRVTNTGDAPASNVKVIGELTSGAESAEVTLRYLPDHSSREGGLYFLKEPRADVLNFRVAGYEAP